jgi:hypothetical protein
MTASAGAAGRWGSRRGLASILPEGPCCGRVPLASSRFARGATCVVVPRRSVATGTFAPLRFALVSVSDGVLSSFTTPYMKQQTTKHTHTQSMLNSPYRTRHAHQLRGAQCSLPAAARDTPFAFVSPPNASTPRWPAQVSRLRARLKPASSTFPSTLNLRVISLSTP